VNSAVRFADCTLFCAQFPISKLLGYWQLSAYADSTNYSFCKAGSQ
jgi:hypothetical protein